MQSVEQLDESRASLNFPAERTDVPAVSRAIGILEAVSGAERPVSLAELFGTLGYPKSSLLGICLTLVNGGLLERTEHGRYALGTRLVGLAHSYLASSKITSRFLETWDALGSMPEETVVLSVLDGTDVVYVACRNGTQGLSLNYRIGMRLPATCTASGKAILSTLAPAALERLFFGQSLQRLTASSIASIADLQSDLDLIRERGYAISEEAVRGGISCVGAPIFEPGASIATAAIALGLLSAELQTPEKRAQVIGTVTRFAGDLTRRLGGGAV